MGKASFIAGSMAFHAVLLAIALLLPAPFPKAHSGKRDISLTFVELTSQAAPEPQPEPPSSNIFPPPRPLAWAHGEVVQGPADEEAARAAAARKRSGRAAAKAAPGAGGGQAGEKTPGAAQGAAKSAEKGKDGLNKAAEHPGGKAGSPAGGTAVSPVEVPKFETPDATAVKGITWEKSKEGYRVTITGDGAFRSLDVFPLESDRVVIDLPGLTSEDKAADIVVGPGILRHIRMYAHKSPKKVRVVLDTSGKVEYQYYRGGRDIVVGLAPAADERDVMRAAEVPAPPASVDSARKPGGMKAEKAPDAAGPGPAARAPAAKKPDTAAKAAAKANQITRPEAPRGTDPMAISQAGSAGRAVKTDKTSISFKYHEGWPVPAMVPLRVDAHAGLAGPADGRAGQGVKFAAKADAGWIILSPPRGTTPAVISAGVDVSKAELGYHEGRITISPDNPGGPGYEVSVTLMVMPKSAGVPELPHYSWDGYMDGDCKVCHLPEELFPKKGFMDQPEFCGLCHNPSGSASGALIRHGGHPVLVNVTSGGSRMPTYGTVPEGPGSDRMDTHLKDGRLVVCVTCHNVMEKPGDYGRTWEITSTKDNKTYHLFRGGWRSMGYLAPKVYAAPGLMDMPKRLVEAKRYLVPAGDYSYDEAEGSVTFNRPRKGGEVVYVTLKNPYLRVTTEHDALCYDCHYENTHMGLYCLVCHAAHGTGNIKAVRDRLRVSGGYGAMVVFRSYSGPGSFADGSSPVDGICETCHEKTKYHKSRGGSSVHADGKDYTGTNCTRCHTHEDGFGI